MKESFKFASVSHTSEFEGYFCDGASESLAVKICQRHSLSYKELRRAELGENIVFLVDKSFVVKIFAWFSRYSRELRALTVAEGRCQIKIPSLIGNGEISGWFYIVTTQLDGAALCNSWNSVAMNDQFEIVSALGVALKQLHSSRVELTAKESVESLVWPNLIKSQALFLLEGETVRRRNQRWLRKLPSYIETNLCSLPNHYKRVLLHGDLHPGNFLLEVENGRWKVTGLIDFADSLTGFHEYDLIKPAMDMAFGSRTLQRTLLLAYGYREKELGVRLRRRLMLLTMLHRSSIWEECVQRLGPKADNLTLEDLEAQIWRFV
jgi:hygromycin-B 7''-O-kinase